MRALRRVGLLTVALAGLGLLGSGVSGVAALDRDLERATPKKQPSKGVLVWDCPKDREHRKAPTGVKS